MTRGRKYARRCLQLESSESFKVVLKYDYVSSIRYLFNQHPEDGGRQPGLNRTPRQGADQLQQTEESGRNHRRDPAVPEPAVLSEGGARHQGERSFFSPELLFFVSCFIDPELKTCRCLFVCLLRRGSSRTWTRWATGARRSLLTTCSKCLWILSHGTAGRLPDL